MIRRTIALGLIGGWLASGPARAHGAIPALASDKGDTAWVLVSTILVLLMILPGLALFYAYNY